MATPALSAFACAGVLATGLLLGGTGVPVSLADTDDAVGVGAAGAQGPSTPKGAGETPDQGPMPDGTPGDGSPGSDSHRPTSTIGNGRNDVVDPNESIADGPGGDAKPARKYKSSILVPVLRIPTWKEVHAPGLTPVSAYFGTAEVRVPFLAGVLGAVSQPEPEPTPGPAFRTQQEAPVLDATPGDGGGVDQVDSGSDGPPQFQVPLVVAPPMPVAAGARMAPIGGSATRAPAMPEGAQPAVAGARAPLIRGSLPPSGQTMTRPLNQANGEPTQGYPRYLRNPTVGELSLIALPGAAGLMFLTFSGGVIGYRQANSARFVRTTVAERFLS